MTPQTIRDWNAETERRAALAADFFRQGYNCSQSVALALADLYDIAPALAAGLSASFGGGVGRMRELCGAASAMFLMAGLEVTEPDDALPAKAPTTTPYPSAKVKKANYEVVQRLAALFKARSGSIHCRTILGLDGSQPTPPTPEDRTEAYYKRRPCIRMVELGVRVYMSYLEQKHAPRP